MGIFSDGVFIKPFQLKNGKWVWIVDEFIGASYNNSEKEFLPKEIADSKKELFGTIENDEDE